MRISTIIAAAALSLAMGVTHVMAQAENYPNKIVRIVVGSSPGGTADTVSRLVAKALTTSLGQTFVVENMPGAGGALAANAVRTSEPDGYTIQFMFSSFSILPSLNPNVKYDPVKDFAPITLVSSVPNILVVHPSFEVKTLQELIDKIKANPGKFDYGSGGIGFSQHLSMEMLLQAIGGDVVHIPYAGSGKLIAAQLAGEIPIAFEPLTAATPHINSGAVIALGVTSKTRSEIFPDVPAIAEIVPGFELIAWNGFVAPAGTPPAIVSKINKGIVDYLNTEEAQTFFTRLGTTVRASTPEEFAELIQGDLIKFAKVIKDANITMD